MARIAQNKERFLKRHAKEIPLLKDPSVGFFHMYTTLGSITKALAELKVSYGTHRSLMVHDPDYFDLVQLAQNFIDDEVEGNLIQVAKGKLEISNKGQLTAMLALLNNRRYKSVEDSDGVPDPIIKRFLVRRPSKKEVPEEVGSDHEEGKVDPDAV